MVASSATARDSCTNANAVTLRDYNGNTDRNYTDRYRSHILYYAPTEITEVDSYRYRSDYGRHICMGNVIRRTISTINTIGV